MLNELPSQIEGAASYTHDTPSGQIVAPDICKTKCRLVYVLCAESKLADYQGREMWPAFGLVEHEFGVRVSTCSLS